MSKAIIEYIRKRQEMVREVIREAREEGKGLIEQFSLFCKYYGYLLDPRNESTPLHHCVLAKDHDFASHLLRVGAEQVHVKDKAGMTPLMYATLNKDVEMVKLLLAHGADVNQRTFSKKLADLTGLLGEVTSFHVAISMGCDEIVNLMLSHADLNACCLASFTPLADMDEAYPLTPFLLAFRLTAWNAHSQRKLIRLLEPKPPRETRLPEDPRWLMGAIQAGQKDLIQFLARSGVELPWNVEPGYGVKSTAFERLILNELYSRTFVEFAVSTGACFTPNLISRMFTTRHIIDGTLAYALERGNVWKTVMVSSTELPLTRILNIRDIQKTAKPLIESLLERHHQDRDRFTRFATHPIFHLVKEGQEGIDWLNLLLERGFVTKEELTQLRTLTGNTLLHEAARRGQHALAEKLLTYIPASTQNALGDTSLHSALRDSYGDLKSTVKVMQLLIAAGASVWAKNKQGFTPCTKILWELQSYNAVPLLDVCLRSGQVTGEQARLWVTQLLKVNTARDDRLVLIRFLLKAHFEGIIVIPNLGEVYGDETLLHRFINVPLHKREREQLLSLNVDPTLLDFAGRTALMLHPNCHEQLFSYMIRAGGYTTRERDPTSLGKIHNHVRRRWLLFIELRYYLLAAQLPGGPLERLSADMIRAMTDRVYRFIEVGKRKIKPVLQSS